MDRADQRQLTEYWHKNTHHLNEQIDDAFKLAQDQAYELGLKRGMAVTARDLEAATIEVGQLKQGMWQIKDAEIARWKDAYENMRDFAVKGGLDITCYGPESV
jgi:hypothetical protein